MVYEYKNYGLYPDRDELIIRVCSGKDTLHIGACDSPFTEEKFEAGLLLHQKLSESASTLKGIDIDEDGVKVMGKLGFDDVELVDVRQYSVGELFPEVIVLGETIEHLDSPHDFLVALKGLMNKDTELLITTPNVYSLGFQSMVLRNQEAIHPDHLLGFSPGLLFQLLDRLGFQVTGCYFTFLPREVEGWKKRIWRTLSRIRHGWSETIVVTAKLNACYEEGICAAP